MESGKIVTKKFRVIRAAFIGLAALPLLLVLIFVARSCYKDYKHEHTPLGTTLADVEKEWGTPDGILGETNGHLKYYYSRNWPEEYYHFTFNKDSVLIEKAVY